MLLLVCVGGFFKGVDCLIKKGVDVNVGYGENILFCCVCQNGKEEMVKFFFIQGIIDIQSLLRFFFEMDYRNIVGLFLQYFGYDKEVGIIVFSNFNLGDLFLEWMLFFFVGNRYFLLVFSISWIDFLDYVERII